MLRVCTLLVLMLTAPVLAQFTEEELKDPFNARKAENMRKNLPFKPDPAVDADAERQMHLLLDSKLGEMRFEGAPLIEVITRLRAVKLNLYVNWQSLEVHKIDRNTPVTIDLSNLRTSDALDALLGRLGGEKAPLIWKIEERYIVAIRAKGEFPQLLTRTYDLPAGAKVADVVRRIEGLDPLSWKERGQAPGTIVPDGSKLIITHNSRLHELIRQELAAAAKAP